MKRFSWDSPGLPEGERCRWHKGLCAYHEADPNRCTYCHAQAPKCGCTTKYPHLTLKVALKANEAAKTGTPVKGLEKQFGLTPSVARSLLQRAIHADRKKTEENE